MRYTSERRNVKGKNGLNCFFSEETYSRFLPKDTFESRLEESLKKVGIHLPPILENIQLDNTKSEPDEESQGEDDYNQSCDMSHDLKDRKDAEYSISYSVSKHGNNESTREDLKDEDIRKDASSIATTTKPLLATFVQKSGEILSGKETKSNANTTPNMMLVESREPPEIVHEGIKTIEKSVKNEQETEAKKSSEHLSQVHSEKIDISKTNRAEEQTALPSSSAKGDTAVVVDKRKRDPSSLEKDPTICRGQDDSKDERTMRQKYYDCNPKRESTHLRDRIKYDREGEYIPCILTMKPRQFSSLIYMEQHRYLTLTHKYRRGFPNYPTEKEITEIEEFKKLERLVQEEQRDFNKYLKDLSFKCKEDYEYIHTDTKKYVEEKLSHTLARVHRYPRYYNLQERISLNLPHQQTGPVLQFVRPLLELGVVSKVVLPVMNPMAPALPKTARTYSQVDENYPASRPAVKGEHVWNHEPCSKDQNAEELAMRNGINIVMSAAALKCLIDTQDTEWSKHWEIPVIVKEYDVFDGEKKIKHKVVYLDKPFYQTRLLSTREKNAIFFKYALQSMVIRPKQRGHVFTNIKTQQKPQPDSSKMKMTMSDADLKETVQAQSHNSHKAKSGPESDTVETVNEQLKVGGNKSDRKVNVEGAVMNETGNDDGVVTSQKETIHPVEEMSVDNNVKDITGDKSKSKAKTSGGMFDMDTNAIDNLETFGMETNWKTMMKGKGKQQLSVSGEIGKSFVKEKTGKGGISELEKLKSELKGLESRAKKETEKAHKLNITSPKGKVLSGTMSQSNDKAVKSTEPIAVTLNDSFNVTTIGSVDFMKKPADLNTNIDKVPAESLLEMTNTISDSMEISATSSNETKESISKHVLNLETVEKLTSSGLQLSSGINLRKRNSPAENVDVSLKKQVSIKDMSKKSVDDSSGSNISAKKYLLRDKAKTVSSGLKMNYQHEHRDEVSCDDDEEDDAGLVIDIPDMPKESDIASNIVIEKTPDSPPASPPASLPASPPASPPGSPPPMSIMDNPKSPGLETPVSPDKSHQSPMSAGLRNTCVIIPLGDDNEDHNVIDFSSKTPDLNIVKREIKIENNSHLEDTNTSNTQKSDVTNDVLKISENLFKGSVSRRSSLRSAGKILEEGNRSDVKEVVQNRRRTRQSLANEENKVDEIVQKSSFEAGTGEGNTDQADETGSLSKRQTDTMLKPGAIKENIRTTRTRSYGGENENNRLSPRLERRSLRHSLDSNETITSPRPDRRRLRHSLDLTQTKALSEPQTDIPVAQKKRKTNVIESDEDEQDNNSEAKTSHSVKDRLAANFEKGMETNRPAKRGRPPKKRQQNNAEADKIKELAEKLKKQMKEKQQSETKEKPDQEDKLSVDGHHKKSDHEAKRSGDGNHHGKDLAGDTKSAVNKEEKMTSHKNEQDSVSNSKGGEKNENQTGTKKKEEDIHVGAKTQKQQTGTRESPEVDLLKGANKTESSNLDAILTMQSEMLKPSGPGPSSSNDKFAARSGLTNLAFPVSGNVIYTQWNLGGVHLMIRCSQHGNIKDANHKNGYVYVTPKLEYQPTFGVEQETISEIARNWISVYVRPTCSLLRARINVYTAEVLLIEEMDYQNLIPPATAFSHMKAFSQLHNVCQKLNRLSTGSYLLTYTPGDEEFNLLKSTEANKRGAYDLQFGHTNIMGSNNKATHHQWIPVDPTILTAQHRKMGRIPLTFQPKDIHMKKKVGSKNRKKKKQKLSQL